MFKSFLRVLTTSITLMFVGMLVSASVAKQNIKQPPYQIIKVLSESTNVSKSYSVSERKTLKKSVGSAVRVMSVDETGEGISLASGTYFVYLGKYYVLTVSHAITGVCDDLIVTYFSESAQCIEYALIDPQIDYAIIQVEEMPSRKPLSIFNSIEFRPSKFPKLLDKMFYTGYPNNIGPLSFKGEVSGFSDNGLMFLNSYAWTGSSGSGVFNSKGKLVGIIMALDVGTTHYGVDVLENLLIVVPTHQIDWVSALHR